jgi:hypothetical protein
MITNKNFSWTGANSIKIYSVNTMTMNDYQASGDSRYGDPEDVGTTLQTWTLAMDRAFAGVIDRLDNSQSQGVMTPGSVLARQLREKVVPEVNTYVMGVINTAGDAAARDDITSDAATTASNAWTDFLLIRADIQNKLGGTKGYSAVMTPQYYNFLKQSGFVLASDKAYGDLKSGNLGTVDGCEIIISNSTEMPTNTNLIITHKDVTTFSDVLTDYVTHENPRGVNGWSLEGRISYDSFVDSNKVNQIGLHRTA